MDAPFPAFQATRQARAYFPRGLDQPDNRFRFSMDALLLACFAPRTGREIGDLGCGCGVVGLAWLLRLEQQDQASVLGLDRDGAMTASANANAARLGLDHAFAARTVDIRDPAQLAPESMDLVLANPPFRVPGTGRSSSSPARSAARFEEEGTLDDFVAAAARLLRNRAAMCMIHLAEHLPRVLAGLSARRLEPKRLLLVHSRSGDPARLCLVEARKNGGPGLRVEPPLVLYEEPPSSGSLTGEALDFCPFLACNAKPAAGRATEHQE